MAGKDGRIFHYYKIHFVEFYIHSGGIFTGPPRTYLIYCIVNSDLNLISFFFLLSHGEGEIPSPAILFII